MRKAILLLLIMLGILWGQDADRKARMAGALTGPKLLVRNDRIAAAVGDDGRFTLGTRSGKPLLFGFDREGATSHTHFNVDSEITGTYSEGVGHPPAPEMVMPPTLIDGNAECKWIIDSVLITQRISPIHIGSEGKLFIEYIFENISSESHSVGLLMFLDTKIGSNDMAPIATEFGYFAIEREFIAPDIPDFWQAYESSPFQPPEFLVGEGILASSGAVMPDRLVYGDYWQYHNVEWDYEFVGAPYSDSSVLLRWDPQTILPGESRYISSYYGEGNVSAGGGSLSLSLSSPTEIIPFECDELTPNPFNINVIVANSSPDSALGVVANIELPEGMSLVGGAPIESIEPPSLATSETGTKSWQVRIDEMPEEDTTYTINISATASDMGTFDMSRNIIVRASDLEEPTITLLSPEETSVISSGDITYQFLIDDESGLVLDDIAIECLENVHSLSESEHLALNGDTLSFSGSDDVFIDADGTFVISVLNASDEFSCINTAEDFVFIFDRSAPEVELLEPVLLDTIFSEEYQIAFEISDDYSDIVADSINIVVNSDIELDLTSYGVSFDGHRLRILSSSFDDYFGSEYELEICLSNIMDNPDYGSPNIKEDECFAFYYNGSSPSISLIEPDLTGYISCDTLDGIIEITHPAGIDEASIAMFINDSMFADISSSYLAYGSDRLNFSIPLSSIDVDSISIGVYAETTEGIETSPINWICHIDRDAPIIEPLTSAIESPDQDIKFLLQDPKSGLNYSSLEISMANTHGSFPLAPEVIADTAIVCIADIPITGCDDVIFNVSIMDNSNLCGHNLKNFFDTLSTPCSYPVIEPEPLSSMYLCDDEIVLKYQISDDEGINIEDAEISIGSRLYDIDDESMVFMRDTLQLTVDLLAFDDGEYEIVLTGVKDIFENTSPDISSSIKIDNRSPEIVTVSPPLEEEIRERDATLNISFADEHSGINYSRSEITIPALGRSFTLDSGDIDISLSELDISGLEELELCCHIFDNAEGCGGNSIDSCFSYNLNFDGPLLEVLTPNTDGIWACSDSFAFSIIDPDGIDESSISIFYQSETYSMDEPEVSLTGHILTFTPEHIPEAEEISLALIASDIHGNSSDSNWEFEFDFTGPIIEIISPSDGIVTHDFRKEFRAIITDNFSGVSAASFEMVLNGTIYDISSPEISIYGDTLIYQPSENYLSSNNMNLHISDLADFCPNTTELSLAFEAIPEPLVIETLQPENEISTGCEFTEFSIEYSSPESLIVETAQILINGEESSQELEISDGIISFEIQSSDFNQGLNRVDVFALADRFSNIYSDTISFSIFYDSSAPEVEYISHNSGMDIPESTSVKILFEDRSGVSKESAVIVSNLSDFDFIWLADTLSLRINDFETDTAEIEISIFDSLDLCPNQAHIVLSYPIEHPEFFIDVLEPHDGSISHMPGQRVLIHARGRNINSAELLINGEALTEEELIFDPISERFTFMPDAEFWQEGQNHLTFSIDENSSFWSFTYDVSPPEVVSLSPSADSHIEDIPELISIDVEDRYSGIDSEMFEITIEDVIIPIGNYSFQNNRFDITIPDLERNFEPGDSVEVRILNLQDNEPDYGYPNSIENELQYYYIYDGNGWIISEKYIFTPNGDGHNDEIIIKTSRESKAKIYNMNGREIKTLAGKGELIWDGKDLNGKDATPGLYMYLIEQEGQIKGKGTIVIAR